MDGGAKFRDCAITDLWQDQGLLFSKEKSSTMLADKAEGSED